MNPNAPNRPVNVPDPDRLRHTPRRFSWIDHRLLRDDHLAACACPKALALYLVLVTASDARGLSYYSDKRLAALLALSTGELSKARRRLIDTGLIAWRQPYYQVLSLDPDDIRQSRLRNRALQERDPERSNQIMSIGDVLRQMSSGPSETKD
jgi:hypothetical protein